MREIDFEAGAAAGSGVDVDEAAALLDDAVDGGETETSALAGFLGGEERLEDAGLSGGVHAVGSVGDGDDHEVSALNRRMEERVARINDEGLGFDGELAAESPGVADVVGEIEENLLNL